MLLAGGKQNKAMTAPPEQIEHVVRRIVDTAHPLRIILFGSAARGDMRPDSDLDVLVVMPEGTHRRRTAQDIYQNLFGIPISVDVVVVTPDDLAQHGDLVGLVYRSALREGREVYAA